MESILQKRMVMCKTEIFFQGSNAVERKRAEVLNGERRTLFLYDRTYYRLLNYSSIRSAQDH